MASDVLMPQMGESIAEGTIVRWIKKVGESVDRDEPLFEISTDKVDAEIPAPAAGVLTEIRHKEGETVGVNTVVAVIGAAGTQPADAQPAGAPSKNPEPKKTEPTAQPANPPSASTQAAPSPQASTAPHSDATADTHPPATGLRHRSSPLVRKIAQDHNVDISRITGTGIAGRVTRDDILAF